ncbi:MAG: bifunctional nuclease family protein [Spirochaetota bacterium]|nr:bifunctional nuclease family protein [Spirochaetota bacterium]
MIPVKIADISLSNLGFVVFLKYEKENKTLPIFIGVPEAQAIAVQFNKLKTPRPLTHDLLKNMLVLLDCRISKVVVNDLIDNTFYAKIFLESKSEKFQVDSRPSDAIALALRFEIPIFVEEKVMEIGAVKVKNEGEVEEKEEPKSQLEVLQDELQAAVAEERYEEAARLRDEIKKLSGHN